MKTLLMIICYVVGCIYSNGGGSIRYTKDELMRSQFITEVLFENLLCEFLLRDLHFDAPPDIL